MCFGFPPLCHDALSLSIGTMRTLTPAPALSATGLPAYLTQTSQRSASNHAVHSSIAFHAIPFLFQRTGRVSDFTMNEQARRHTPPNRVRHSADRQFASGCSPPHLAVTQLPSTTGLWLTPTRTSTVQFARLHGRTHPGERRDPHGLQSGTQRATRHKRSVMTRPLVAAE